VSVTVSREWPCCELCNPLVSDRTTLDAGVRKHHKKDQQSFRRESCCLSFSTLCSDLHRAANTQQLRRQNLRTAETHLWNSVPVQQCNLDITHGLFRRQLKRHLFREAWTRRSVTSDMLRLRKTFTYLLTLMLLIEWQEEHLDCKNLPKTYRQTFSSRTSNWRKLRGTS